MKSCQCKPRRKSRAPYSPRRKRPKRSAYSQSCKKARPLNILTRSQTSPLRLSIPTVRYETGPEDPTLKAAYDRMLSYLENLLRDRFANIREQLAKIHSGHNLDGYSLTTDPQVVEASLAQFEEAVGESLAAEREQYIEKLSHEVTALNEKLIVEKHSEAAEKKKKYKAMLRSVQKSEEQLRAEAERLRSALAEKEQTVARFDREVIELRDRSNRDKDKAKDMKQTIQDLRADLMESKTIH